MSARRYSGIVNSLTLTPTRRPSTMWSQSPTPPDTTTGRPEAKYSPIFVGKLATFEGVGWINAVPTVAIDSHFGIWRYHQKVCK